MGRELVHCLLRSGSSIIQGVSEENWFTWGQRSLTDLVSARTWTPLREYCVWWSQEILMSTDRIYTGCPRRNVQYFGSVPYVKVYRYNPKHLYPKLNGYGDNGQRKVRTSCISAFCTPTAVSRATPPSSHLTAWGAYVGKFNGARAPPNAIRQYFIAARYANAWNPKDNRGY